MVIMRILILIMTGGRNDNDNGNTKRDDSANSDADDSFIIKHMG